MRARTRVLIGLLAVAVVGVGVAFAQFSAPPPGEGGVTGRFWGQDDTGIPDLPLSDGNFLVVPGATVHELWPGTAETGEGPWFTTLSDKFNFDEFEQQYGATIVEVQSNGRFRIVSPPGPTVICLVVGEGGVFGCSELELPEHGSLRATRGEGGFRIYHK